MTEITERLHLERDALSSSDIDDGLRNVRRTVRRRRRQNSFIGAAAAGGLLVAGIGVASVVGSDTEEVVVTDTAPAVTTGTEAAATPASTAPPVTTTAPGSNDATTLEPVPVVPTVGEPIIGSSAGSDLIQVTEEFRSVAGDDFGEGWQVPWNDGFLVGGNLVGSDESAAFFSPDGRTWEPVDVEPGIDYSSRDGVLVADDRLVMIGGVDESGWPQPVVASTTDLTNWSIEEVPVEPPPADLPATVQAFTWPRMITANADGWIANIDTTFSLNIFELAEQRTGRTVTNLSEARSDDGILITLDADVEDVESEDVWITWIELEEEIGIELTEAIRGSTTTEVWTGTWDGEEPARVEDPDDVALLSSFEPLVAVDNAFVTVKTTRNHPDDAPPVDSTELFANIDGRGWSALDTPISEHVEYAFPLDVDLGVVAKADDATISIYRVDLDAETWTPIEVPGLPDTTSFVETFGTAALDLDAAPEAPIDYGPYTEVVEKSGYRLTTEYELYTSSYEVVSIETGEVIVAESIDLRDVEGAFETAFEYLTGGLVDTLIVDPATGDVLMDISAEEREAANPQESTFGPDPEPWIVATEDGVKWFVREVPPRNSDSDLYSQEAMTVSGGRLLYWSDSREWFVVDLT